MSTSRSGIGTIPDICCPSAALLDEIGRCADATKRVYTDGVLAVIGDFAARLAPHDPQSAHAKVLSIYAVMIGALQLSARWPIDSSPTRSSRRVARLYMVIPSVRRAKGYADARQDCERKALRGEAD